MNRSAGFLALLVSIVSLSSLGYTSLYYRAAYDGTLLQLRQERSAWANAGALSHRIVDSVDLNERSITYRVECRVHTCIPGETGKFYLSDYAFIGHQALEAGPDGIYDRLSPITPASLSDIRPGDHIAFTRAGDASGRATSYIVLFGNPL